MLLNNPRIKVLYPIRKKPEALLYEEFHRIQAISMFDLPFTTNQESPKPFATDTG
jgi:hypothetical protein